MIRSRAARLLVPCLALVFAAALAVAWSPQPRDPAQTESAARSTGPIADGWVEVDPAKGASCGNVSSIARSILLKTAERAKARGCNVTTTGAGGLAVSRCAASRVAIVTSDMIDFWNSMVANSWATIGPRDWPIYPSPKSQSGTIRAYGTRLFVSPHPMFLTDKVRVSVRKVEGMNATNVTFCASNLHGQVSRKWELRLTGSTPDGKLYTKEFTGLRGFVPSVNFAGTQLTRQMQYRVRGTGLN